jgi:hypothetical protein
MVVGFMKMFGGIFASITNAIVIMQSDDETEAVKDFIAVGIIYEIDNIVAGTLFDNPSKKMISDDRINIEVKKENDNLTDIKIWEKFSPTSNAEDGRDESQRLDCGSFILLVLAMVLYRIFALFYQVIYFYFAPLTVIFIYYKKLASDVREVNKAYNKRMNLTKTNK